ncbi:MAG: hypothetical protein ACPLPR_02925 [Bacillota bacterium]
MDQVQSASAVARAVEAERISQLGLAGTRTRGEVPFSLQSNQAQAVGRVAEASPCHEATKSRDVRPGTEGGNGRRGFYWSGKKFGKAKAPGRRGLLLDERR